MTVPLFAFPPNWSQSSYKVTREFKTDILTSRSGKEQRRALRTSPRKMVEYTTSMHGSALRTAHALLAKWQDQTAILPDFSRSQAIATQLNSGASTVSMPSIPAWLSDGVTVALGDDGQAEAFVVQSVVGLVVTFTTNAVNTWPPGTNMRPGLQGRMDPELAGSQLTDAVASLDVKFDVQPTSERQNVGSAGTLFNGREMFLLERNWAESSSPTYKATFDTLDFGFGPILYYNPVAFRTRVHQAVYTAKTPAAAEAVEQLFERMKGRRGEFYMPTWENDLPLKLSVGSASFAIRVDGRATYDAFNGDTVFKAIAICLNDGTVLPRKVASLTLVTDGNGTNDTLVNLASVVGQALAPSAVRCISWMPVWRFATDALTTEWLTDHVAQIQLNQQTVEDLAPE